jgi:hypothetical protein
MTMTSMPLSGMRALRILPVALVALMLGTAGAAAQTPKFLGQDRDWGAYSVEVDDDTTCYVLTRPKDQSPKNVRRDPVYFFVTFRPKDKIRNQVSIIAGYPYNKESRATIEVGPAKFTLFTRDDKAWIEDIAEQDKLVAAMKAGSTMIVRGTSERGTNTTDRYSLLGVTAALDRTAKACP